MARNQLNVVLTGFMGTGKTTVGRATARLMARRLVDTDRMIVERHGPIPTIFAEHGEATFRQYENAVAEELADRNKLVISTGGRFMLDPTNAAAMNRTGRVYCLHATVDEILDRTGRSARKRPLLDTPDPRSRIEELLAERSEGYGQFTQISTSKLTPEEIAEHIIFLHENRSDDTKIETPTETQATEDRASND